LRIEACNDDEVWTASVSDSGRRRGHSLDAGGPVEWFDAVPTDARPDDVQVHSDRYGTSVTITLVNA
jgi:hypothetical protein